MQNKDLIKTLEEQNSLLIEEQKELKEHLGHKYGEKQAVIRELSDTIRENIKTIISIKNKSVEFNIDNPTNYVFNLKAEKEKNELGKNLEALKDLRASLSTFTSIESKEDDVQVLDFAINLIVNNTPDVKEVVKKAFKNKPFRIEGKDENRIAEITEKVIYKFKNKKIRFTEAIELTNNTMIALNEREYKINTNDFFDKITEDKYKNPIIKEIIDVFEKEDITYSEAGIILEYVKISLNVISKECFMYF